MKIYTLYTMKKAAITFAMMIVLVGTVMVSSASESQSYEKVWDSGAIISNPAFDVAVGDTDGDGNPDIIVSDHPMSGSAKIYVFENTGDDSYQLVWNSGTTFTMPLCYMEIGDQDGDGKLEIIALESSGTQPYNGKIHVFENNGDNTYQEVWNSGVDLSGIEPSGLFLGEDADNDGKREIIIGTGYHGDGKIRVYENTGDNTYQEVWNSGSDLWDTVLEGAVGDTDGDGIKEIVVGSGDLNPQVHVFECNGDDSYELVSSLGTFNEEIRAIIGDQDGDGKSEIIAGGQDGVVHVFEHTGVMGENTYTSVWNSGTMDGFIDVIATGDQDNDGNGEMIVPCGDGKVYLFENSGDNTYQEVWNSGSVMSGHIYRVATGDQDGDGKLEIIATSLADKKVYVFENAHNIGGAELTLSPESWDFGTVTEGSQPQQTFTITNDGTVDLVINDIIPRSCSYISISDISLPATITPGGSPETFIATTDTTGLSGSISEIITILSNDSDEGTVDISVSGDVGGLPRLESVTIPNSGEGFYTFTKGDTVYIEAAVYNPSCESIDVIVTLKIAEERDSADLYNTHSNGEDLSLQIGPTIITSCTWVWEVPNEDTKGEYYVAIEVHAKDDYGTCYDCRGYTEEWPSIIVDPSRDTAGINTWMIGKVPYYPQGQTGWCGQHSLKMVLQWWGSDISIGDINDYLCCHEGGTCNCPACPYRNVNRGTYLFDFNLWDCGPYSDLPHAATHFGFKTYVGWRDYWEPVPSLDVIKSQIDQKKPIIVALIKFGETVGHYSVVVGYDDFNQRFYIHDPAGAWFNPSSNWQRGYDTPISYEQFRNLWDGNFQGVPPRYNGYLVIRDDSRRHSTDLSEGFSDQRYTYTGPRLIHLPLVETIPGIRALSTCPVDISINDPDSLIVNKQLRQIPDATYTEIDIDGDGTVDDEIWIPKAKIGYYQVTVTPEPDAEDTDTYTLTVSAGDTTIVLAQNVPISDIPDQPYIIRSTENTIVQIIPATIDLEPETLNLKSNGKWITTYIELPEGYDVADIDVSTIYLVDAIPIDTSAPATVGDYDSDGISDVMVKFDRTTVVAYLGTGDVTEDETGTDYCEELTLTGELTDGTPFEGSDRVRIIDKG